MQRRSKAGDKLSGSGLPSTDLLHLDLACPTSVHKGSTVGSHLNELSSLFAQSASTPQEDEKPAHESPQPSFSNEVVNIRANPMTDVDELDDFGDFVGTDKVCVNPSGSPNPSGSIPPPHVLLPLFRSGIWSTIPSFLTLLTPLDYPLRRRVLSHGKTKEYINGVKESARVAGRVMAGRTVRSSLPKATKEARETERVWHDLLPRLRAVAGHDMPVLRADLTVSADVVGQACVLCGVSKKEKLNFGEGRRVEILHVDGLEWHRSCRAWWVQEEKVLARAI